MIIRPTHIDELPRLATFLSENGMERSSEVLRWKFWDSCGALLHHSRLRPDEADLVAAQLDG